MYDHKTKIVATVIITAIILTLFTLFVSSEDAPRTSARAAALYIPETDTFVCSKNMNERLGMASTTKIMTALISLERLMPDSTVRVDPRAVGTEGSSVYLESGETMSAEDLIYSLMLRSANDAAAALAYEISGSIEDFAALMNERARSLGLSDTSFKNPHGLDEEGHYTTAHDLAIITAEAMKNEAFRKIVSTYKKNVTGSCAVRLVVNHNKLLRSYDGAIGVKTGYTKRCGRSLVGAAERDGLTLISVTIDAPNDWSDHKRLLDYGFMRFHKIILPDSDGYEQRLPVVDGIKKCVAVGLKQKFSYIYEGDEPDFKENVILDRFAVAPLRRGDVLGKITYSLDGNIIGECEIIALEDIAKTPKKRATFDIFNK